MNFWRIYLKLFLHCVFVSSCVSISCKNEAGQDVDWFIVYKLPKTKNSGNRLLQSGYSYAFITNEDNRDWTFSSKNISSGKSVFGNTLSPLYRKRQPKTFSYLAYNDDPPGNKSHSSYLGHSKGLMASDQNAGFWLVHSVPNFPPFFNESYSYPETAAKYGQTALCVTFTIRDNANSIANQLLYIKPNFYELAISDDLLNKAPNFQLILDKKYPKKSFSSQLSLTSQRGQQFISFAKSGKFGNDLYSTLVAPGLQSNLLVETWRNGAGDVLDSNCTSRWKVQNIDDVKFEIESSNNRLSEIDWSYLSDHSKWVITESDSQPYTCIGDINRMRSQFKRGGGTLCLKYNNVWKRFMDAVRSIEGCKLTKRPKSKPRKNSSRSRSSGKLMFNKYFYELL